MAFTPEQIRQHVATLEQQGLSGNDLFQRMYDDAQTAGVSMAQIDQAMGFNPGTSQQWVSNNITPQVTMAPNMAMANPPTGLIGAEQALQAGTTSALDVTQQAANIARGDIAGAAGQAQQQLAGGREQVVDAALTANQMAQQGLAGGRKDILDAALFAQGMGSAPLAPLAGMGTAATAQQSALSGALGPEAQAQAFANFQASPGQEFLRNEAERALTRNQAAIGGLGGGNVRRALQEQAVGLAAQDFGNQFNRLGAVADRGANAAQGIASLTGGLGGAAVSGLGSLAGTGANITGNLGGQVVNQLGGSQQLGAQMTGQAGQGMANIAQGAGTQAANLMAGTGQQVAQNRLQTGQLLAGNLGAGSSQLADLANQLGISQSDLMGVASGNLSNILSGTGAQSAVLNTQLAQLLSNIATGQATTLAGLPGIPEVQAGTSGIQDAAAITNMLGGLMQSGFGNQPQIPLTQQPISTHPGTTALA